MTLQQKLDKMKESMGEEKAKEYARALGGFPKGMTLASVNGHTRGWDEGFAAAVELLLPCVEALEEWRTATPTDEHGNYCPINQPQASRAKEALSTLERLLSEGGKNV